MARENLGWSPQCDIIDFEYVREKCSAYAPAVFSWPIIFGGLAPNLLVMVSFIYLYVHISTIGA